MKRRALAAIMLGGLVTSAIIGCTQSSDSCDGLEGYHTHSVIEITGIESALPFTRIDPLVAVDQTTGTDFSNLIIQIDMSWSEEQQRFRAPNTILHSFADWFISPASACSFAPYHEDYQPAVVNVEIHSDTDLNTDYLAGSELKYILAITGMAYQEDTPPVSADYGDPLSARRLRCVPISLRLGAYALRDLGHRTRHR